MLDKIKEALAKLDVNNDDHWTGDGLPRLDVMKDLLGEAVTRADVTSAVKGFSRKTPEALNPEPTIDEGNNPESTGSGEVVVDEGEVVAESETVEEVEEVSDNEEALIEKELEEATKVLQAAQKRHRDAVAAMDVVIAQREAKAAGRTTAHDIKEYQKSQAMQRARAAERRKLAVAAMQGLQTKY